MNKNGLIKLLLVFLLTFCNNSFAQKIPYDSLNVKLEKILIEDQSIRIEIDTLYANNADSARINKAYALMRIKNDEHLEFIAYVLDTFNWPPKDSLSKKANIGLFLAVQHSKPSFKKKYFPIIEKGLKKGNIDIEDYAYLIDRYNIQCDNYQIYGTQTTSGEWGGNFFFSDSR